MHVAGRTCGICNQPIRGILDGEFCADCGAPVHRACASPPTPSSFVHCRTCGSPRAAGAESTRAKKRETAALQRTFGRQDVRNGCLVLLAGAACTACGLLTLEWKSLVIPTGLFAVGLGMVFRGLNRQRGRHPDESNGPG